MVMSTERRFSRECSSGGKTRGCRGASHNRSARVAASVERCSCDCHVVWSAFHNVTSDTNRSGENFLAGKKTSGGQAAGKLPAAREAITTRQSGHQLLAKGRLIIQIF